MATTDRINPARFAMDGATRKVAAFTTLDTANKGPVKASPTPS